MTNNRCGAAALSPASPSSSSSPTPWSRGSRIAPPSCARRVKKRKRARGGGGAVVAPARGSSIYRGVCRHIGTGRYGAHLWDRHRRSTAQERKGGQGSYDTEEAAARTYDLAALKYWGSDCGILNFPVETYKQERERMQRVTRQEYLAQLRRHSCGFARGASKYRGVARHHQNGRWEARIRYTAGEQYAYLDTEEEAARAYDLAAIQIRGLAAVTNFGVDRYMDTDQEMAARPGTPRPLCKADPDKETPAPPPLLQAKIEPKDEPGSPEPEQPAPVLHDDVDNVDRAIAVVLQALCVDRADFDTTYNQPRRRCWPSSDDDDDDVRDLPRDVGFEDDIESVLFADAPGYAAADAEYVVPAASHATCAAASASSSASGRWW